jgi:hypothetical protein
MAGEEGDGHRSIQMTAPSTTRTASCGTDCNSRVFDQFAPHRYFPVTSAQGRSRVLPGRRTGSLAIGGGMRRRGIPIDLPVSRITIRDR